MKTNGYTYTSNCVKLLKHLDKLQLIQDGKPPSPIMAHISLTNLCDLSCSFCCFANRKFKQYLPLDDVKKALESFKTIGVLGIEFTGGGEPALYPYFEHVTQYAHDLGFKLGICTNGKTLKNIASVINFFSWVRLGLYGFYEGYDYDLSAIDRNRVTISAAYVWDEAIDTSNNPNITQKWDNPLYKRPAKHFQNNKDFLRMIRWVEDNKIPTRIAFNAIKSPEDIEKDLNTIRGILKGLDLEYAFLSDFNYKSGRRNDHCYMHMIKPFLFTDGYLYTCPSAELSPENNYNYVPDSEFKLCDIDGIEDFFSMPASVRIHACKYCKYAMQNELIDDIVKVTIHNEFA